MSINILALDLTILQKIESDDIQNEERLRTVDALIAESNYPLDQDVKQQLTEIKECLIRERCTSKEFYIAKTCMLLEEYKNILKNPISHRKEMSLEISRKKRDIIDEYLGIVQSLIQHKGWDDIAVPSVRLRLPVSDAYCNFCHNDDENCFEVDEFNRKICIQCSTQQASIEIGVTHRDYNRFKIVSKFIYNRILHFQDCIKQYQGKQNCKIPDALYRDLDEKFKAYRLLVPVESDASKHLKYAKVTRQHILLFLKELKYAKHFENVNLIYFNLTNKRVDDITYLEEKLIEDFKQLVILYDSLHGKDKSEELGRKNFMNVQYLLFQLLRRHDHKCQIENFTVLKTIDRKIFHDNICRKLFDRLRWKFTPTF